jgi:hypothetical protein
MSKLLFIDTNIYLDFYRIRSEIKTPFLAHLEAIKEWLITTDQVEMEFYDQYYLIKAQEKGDLNDPEYIETLDKLMKGTREEGIDKASILAYYSIFSSLFLLTFFTFLFTRFLGDPDLTLKTVYPFSPDFTSRVSPED